MDIIGIIISLCAIYYASQSEAALSPWYAYYEERRLHFPKMDFYPIPSSTNMITKNFTNNKLRNNSVKLKTKNILEGSACRRSFDGRTGVCTLATNCLPVIRQARLNGVKVDICSYKDRVAVICCPELKKKKSAPMNKRISVQKCEEYNDFVASFRYKRNASTPIPKCTFVIPLIIGGTVTYPGEYPHMAAVGWKRRRAAVKWGCGGSLISEYFVLTAAHCREMNGVAPDVIRLGGQNLLHPTSETEHQDFWISKIISHPNYTLSSYYHDIALMKLSRRVVFSRFVKPICLWQFPDVNAKEVTAIGWGKTAASEKTSDELRKVDLRLATNKLCNTMYKPQSKLPEGIIDAQICAGVVEGGKDTCAGDSGGPIQITVPEGRCIYYVVGITSFGRFCGTPFSLGVYTRVYHYLDWIEQIAFPVSFGSSVMDI